MAISREDWHAVDVLQQPSPEMRIVGCLASDEIWTKRGDSLHMPLIICECVYVLVHLFKNQFIYLMSPSCLPVPRVWLGHAMETRAHSESFCHQVRYGSRKVVVNMLKHQNSFWYTNSVSNTFKHSGISHLSLVVGSLC